MTDEQIEKMRRYIELEGTEVGEMLDCLVTILERYEGYCPEDLFEEIKTHVKEYFNYFENNFKIIEEEETRKIKKEKLVEIDQD